MSADASGSGRLDLDADRRARFTSVSSTASGSPDHMCRRRNTKPSIDVQSLRPPGFFRNVVVSIHSPKVSLRREPPTPLLRAYQAKDYDEFERLAGSADLYAPIWDKRTIADIAAGDGDLHAIDILDNSRYNFNKKNLANYVSLHYAVEAKQVKAMRKLVNLGANPNIPLPSGEYLLHRACGIADMEVLTCLLERCHADVDVTDRQNNSPLHRACLEDSARHVAVLLDYCNDEVLNSKGYEGKTALHIAVINQNRKAIALLLNRGAFIDIQSDSKKTVIDQVLGIGSVVMMSDLAHFFTQEMTKTEAKSYAELFQEPQFLQYLNFLDAVDNEYQVCEIRYDKIDEESEKELLSKLETDDKIDLIEFREVVLKLLQTEVIHVLSDPENHDVLLKTCGNIVRYVLFREDCVMLERIMSCGIVWWEIRTQLEKNIDELYVHSTNRGFNGSLMHLAKNFVSDHRIDREAFVKFYSKKCSTFKLQTRRDLQFHMQTDYMRHPMDTLVMWSVFTGRHKLTEVLLRQEKFDVVPLALYCAAVLRAFVSIEDMSVDTEEMENQATKFEMFAAQIVENVYQLDTSVNKHVAVGYLLQKLPSYGDVSCIQLAARNSSAKFLQTTPGQEALDKRWFGNLLNLNAYLREMIIWLGATPGCFFIPLILFLLERRRLRKTRGTASMFIEGGADKRRENCHFLLADRMDESNSDEPSPATVRRTKSFDSRSAESSKNQPKGSEKGQPSLLGVSDLRDSTLSAPPQLEARKHEKDSRKEKSAGHLKCISGADLCTYASQLYAFYGIPAVKFRYHALAHIILLLLLSYIILLDLEYEISVAEVVAYLIIFGFLMEEMAEFGQYLAMHASTSNFFASKWNIIDLLALLSAVVGFCLRMTRCHKAIPNAVESLQMDFGDNVWYAARLFLGTTCLLYWVRLLYISTVLEVLGPKLKMIAKMIIKDMIPFLFILFIFILGFGVLIHGLLFPNGHKAWNKDKMTTQEVLVAMFRICFYSMVGEYSLDVIDGQEECAGIYGNQTLNSYSCPHQLGKFLVPNLVMPLYVIITEILLLNLIIALFSKTIDEIDSRSKALWQFERHELIEEFEMRSCLPPPFNVLDVLKRLVRRLLRGLHDFGFFKEPFDQQPILQYLLFQAFVLRNNRGKLMDSSSPRHDETEDLLWQIREIVKQELKEQSKEAAEALPANQGQPSAEIINRIDATRGTLLDAKPTLTPNQTFATLMEEDMEEFDQI